MDKSSYELFSKRDFKDTIRNSFQPVIIADQIRTPENMGLILRLAANYDALKVLFISEKNSGFKNYKINRAASGAAEKIDWKVITLKELENEVPKDYQLVALETTNDAVNIHEFAFPQKTAFVIGNEVNGISDLLLHKVQSRVFIPIPGIISSLNVTHALSAGFYEWFRQMSSSD